jgi:hypothetical protein
MALTDLASNIPVYASSKSLTYAKGKVPGLEGSLASPTYQHADNFFYLRGGELREG